ncbi:MAG TPA: hypothetical protein DCX95_06160 [Elusimicrobia bacterium]|nr:hypothetical protein [Elusimicrobiota bacterium]
MIKKKFLFGFPVWFFIVGPMTYVIFFLVFGIFFGIFIVLFYYMLEFIILESYTKFAITVLILIIYIFTIRVILRYLKKKELPEEPGIYI